MDEQYDTSDHSDFLQHAVHKSQHNDVMPEQRCCGATTVGRAETTHRGVHGRQTND